MTNMYRNYKKYRKFVVENFQKYLNNEIDWKELYDKLHTIQSELGFDRQRIGSMKAIWFKFTEDDKLSCTINELISELRFGSNRNRDYMKDQMKMAVENPKGLQIYYS
jgi:hypothetical protein